MPDPARPTDAVPAEPGDDATGPVARPDLVAVSDDHAAADERRTASRRDRKDRRIG